jgi:hypothetical protein
VALKKIGSPQKITVIKRSSFAIDVNYLVALIEKQSPTKAVSLDQLHNAVKSIGILSYTAEDMNSLVSRLQAVGFKITK